MKTNEEMLGKMEVRIEDNHENFEVLQGTLVSQMDNHRERTMTCLGKTEATALEANSAEFESGAEHREIPKEGTAVKSG
jgi:hypothetical protein